MHAQSTADAGKPSLGRSQHHSAQAWYLLILDDKGGEAARQDERWEDPGDRIVEGDDGCLQDTHELVSKRISARCRVEHLHPCQGLRIVHVLQGGHQHRSVHGAPGHPCQELRISGEIKPGP